MNKPIRYGLFLLIVIFAINLIISLIMSLIVRNYPILSWQFFVAIVIGALMIAMIITGLVIYTAPVLKDFLVTYRTLLRLESLSHPLLLKLSTEAPGTYNHSLVVANLANRAAKAIHADSMLARVGGYYHDIGKLSNPQAFIENQIGQENLHEELNNPSKSAQIIINHVAEGTKLAKEYKLPDEAISLIASHHGTTIISYFYDKALANGIKVKKEDFRYPGPKPISKEGAILMMADAIEAKIRLIKEVKPSTIRETVDEVINARVDEKQLELAGLSTGDLNKIRESFIQTLGVIFHQRIDYPKTNQSINPK